MKRWMFKLVVVLILGAIVNVAVAWGFVSFGTPKVGFDRYPQQVGGYVRQLRLRPSRADNAHGRLVIEVQILAGWPSLCLRHDETLGHRTEKVLPYHPTWPGFASNTFFYAAILWLPFAPFQLRRYVRVKRGLCIKCGYDLRGDFSAGCPECGWRREDVP